MQLFLDTTKEDIFISLIKKNKTHDFIHLKNIKNKSEKLPFIYEELLKKTKIKTESINSIFTLIGPGSFMGIRACLLFAQTISLIKKVPLFICDNFTFISQNINGTYFINASNKTSYKGVIKNKKLKIEIVDKKTHTIFDYNKFIENPLKYLLFFKKIKNVLKIDPLYIKDIAKESTKWKY